MFNKGAPSPGRALDAALGDVRKGLAHGLELRTNRGARTLGGKSYPALEIEITSTAAGTAQLLIKGSMVAIPDAQARTQVAMCLAEDGLPLALERCQHGYEALVGRRAFYEWPE